jgi:hypothetical protein
MKRFFYLLLLPVCIWPALAGAVIAPQDLEKQEDTAMRISRQLDSLEAAHSQLRVQADVLARQIDVLRSRQILSAGEHRQLEKQLRQSQVLENRMQEMGSAENSLWKEYRPTLENLMQSYHNQIEFLAERMGSETDGKTREALLRNFNETLRKKGVCETLLYENFSTTSPDRNITALRKEIGVVEGHIRSLQKEEQVRRKAEELTLGMRMFNPGEELMGREIPVSEPSDVKSTGFLNRDPEGIMPVPAREGLGSDESDVRTDPVKGAWRSLADLQDQIRELRHLKNTLALRADTLRTRAHYCADLLKERRKQQ